MVIRIGFLVVAGWLVAAAPAWAAADAAAGRAVFEAQCAACHALDPEQTMPGPSLRGVVGRASGAIEDFDYSPAMLGAHKIWDAATLNAYLAAPQAMVPGTKMIFPGLPDAGQRADVIAYLGTQK